MRKKTNSEFINIAEVDLVYKSKVKAIDRHSITSSSDAYKVFLSCWESDKLELVEQFKVLFMNRANQVLGVYHLSTGGITGTVADPRLIFTAALKLNTCAVILAHNHPSGSLRPSQADEDLTAKIKGAGNFLDIKVLDHLIIHSEGYYSFADEGLL
jgi:DNA repair protein RadC